MSETAYKDYIIKENDEGYFQIGNMEFPTFDEALDWVDSEFEETDYPIIESKPRLRTYRFFYVDDETDRCFSEDVDAYNFQEAERLLRSNYDVYSIVGYYII